MPSGQVKVYTALSMIVFTFFVGKYYPSGLSVGDARCAANERHTFHVMYPVLGGSDPAAGVRRTYVHARVAASTAVRASWRVSASCSVRRAFSRHIQAATHQMMMVMMIRA